MLSYHVGTPVRLFLPLNEWLASEAGKLFHCGFWKRTPPLARENEDLLRLFRIYDSQEAISPALQLFGCPESELVAPRAYRIWQEIEEKNSVPEARVVREAEVALDSAKEPMLLLAGDDGFDYFVCQVSVVGAVDVMRVADDGDLLPINALRSLWEP